MRSLTHPRSITLFEQAIVSATGFLSMLFFARHLSTLDWATFSFAASLLLLSQGMQLSIVILPMISFSQGHRPSELDQGHWTWLNRAVLLTMLALSALTGGLVVWSTANWMGYSLLLAAMLIPPAFTYEYLRRRLILADRYGTLARAGAAYALGVGLGVLINLALDGTPWMAALSYWCGIMLALPVAGEWERLRWAAPDRAWLLPLRRFAPAAVGSSLAFAGYNLVVQALLGRLAGPAAVAAFNATRMLIQPVNTLTAAFNNLDLPNAAKAYARGGRALISFQRRAVMRLMAVGGVYLLAVALLAEPMLQWLYGGRYSDQHLLWAWVLVGLLMLGVSPVENVFYLTRRPQRLFASRMVAAGVGIYAAWWAIPAMGAVGAVLSIAGGWVVALAGGLLGLWSVRGHGGAPPTDAPVT